MSLNPQATKRRGRPYGLGIKLSQIQASEIRKLYWSTKTSLRKLAKEFGVSHQTIFFIVHGCIWVKL